MSVAVVGRVIFSNCVEAPYLIAGGGAERPQHAIVGAGEQNPPTTVLGNVNALLHGGAALPAQTAAMPDTRHTDLPVTMSTAVSDLFAYMSASISVTGT